jgi:hypothetical protein
MRMYLFAGLAGLAAVASVTAHAGDSSLRGPLVFHYENQGYVGVVDDDALEVRALAKHGSNSFVWPTDGLEALLAHGDLIRVTLPAAGKEGQVVDGNGRCLSMDPLASGPSWLPCSPRFENQVWHHEDGTLWSTVRNGVGGYLSFIPNFSSRGPLVTERGGTSLTLVTAVLTETPAVCK